MDINYMKKISILLFFPLRYQSSLWEVEKYTVGKHGKYIEKQLLSWSWLI